MNQSILPHSKEAEMMVLGCMLTNIKALPLGVDLLKAEDFYFGNHRDVFQILSRLHKANRPADIHLVAEELRMQESLDRVGGTPYLVNLAQFCGTSAYIEEYIEIIRSKACSREMIEQSASMQKELLLDPSDPKEIAQKHAKKMADIEKRYYQGSQMVFLKDVINGKPAAGNGRPFLQALEQRSQHFRETGSALTGLPTGFADLDKQISILDKGNIIVIGGRPGSGKTALALTIGEHVLARNESVLFFSLEMTSSQLLSRLVSIKTGVDGERLRRGDLSSDEFEKIKTACEDLSTYKLMICDNGGASISKILCIARSAHEIHGCSLIIIDYLQLLNSEVPSGNRHTEISEISRKLKQLALELDIPIVCVAQLSRKVEDREGHRPILSDLKDSGQIEQDCDVAMFILRKELYDKYDKPGIAEVIIAKNRHGPLLTVDLCFDAPTTKFSDYVPINGGHINQSSLTSNAFSRKTFSKKSAKKSRVPEEEED